MSTFGRYIVGARLGEGGFAEVHRAELVGIEGFRKNVALKRLLPNAARDPQVVEMFLREARLASQLQHANIAQVYELGETQGTYFMAVELIEGYSLEELIVQCCRTTGPMPVSVALAIVIQLCSALEYAHDLGIVHRDVSPSNVMLTSDGVAKLIDFGIARITHAEATSIHGTVKGKFGYMAPEYLTEGRLDARSDIFAVGVLAHELLTNASLFTRDDDAETLQRLRGLPIPPPSAANPEVDTELDHLVLVALARDPERRWQRASALGTALQTIVTRRRIALTHDQIARWISSAFAFTARDTLVDNAVADPRLATDEVPTAPRRR